MRSRTEKREKLSVFSESPHCEKGQTGEGAITRRSFLSASGALIGAVALPGAAALAGPGGAYAAESEKAPVSDLPLAEPIPPVPVPSKWDMEADIVVVGTGGGGLAAATYCASQGLSVIAVEKMTYVGGGTRQSSVFICPGGTRYQNAIKFVRPDLSFPYNPEEAAAAQEKLNPFRTDMRLMRALATEGPKCVDWMGDLGVDWDFDPQFGPVAHCWRGSCDGDFYPFAMDQVVKHMQSKAEEFGAKFFLSTKCEALVEDNGRAVGIKVKNLDDKETFIHAKKAVILTAGGFVVNHDMLQKYCPSGYKAAASSYQPPSDTGECTRMALGMGADMTGFDAYKCFDGGIEAFQGGTGPFYHFLYSGDNQLSRQPWLGIDKTGKRYAYRSNGNEAGPLAPSAQEDQSYIETNLVGNRAYVIFDADYETNIFKLGQAGCRRPILPTMANVERIPEFFHARDWKDGVKSSLEAGRIKQADTLEELAKMLGLEPEVVTGAVKNWNTICEAGVDPEFNYRKDWLIPVVKPPYYGIKIGGQISDSSCGVRVNPQMQVINTDGKVIPGLYAGFMTAGGQVGASHTGMNFLATNGLSWTGGYIAAQNAVKE